MHCTALFPFQIAHHKEPIGIISTEATQEAALEGMLDRVHEKWRYVEFTVNPYKEMKDTYILVRP